MIDRQRPDTLSPSLCLILLEWTFAGWSPNGSNASQQGPRLRWSCRVLLRIGRVDWSPHQRRSLRILNFRNGRLRGRSWLTY
ncbi:hypothetical protein JMJ77_0006708 [Colletotrichum scovillei]|uniref:Uncharacterized protein n=1 Tax=Colletotrichum scovillei TaxID=1209932 RepID=A0A9P7RJP7_9PEZI|nr:hypothetical protein JMJ77_0006708 [Colletotrichum scovillei]KAG7077950.1 hypothetical protein JMJ76_0015190 [Colletotrichum scovillei]